MESNYEWWDGFFSDLWLEVQSASKNREQTNSETEFIQDVLQLPPNAKVLDVPCGDGRHSIGLAQKGFQVTGVDITKSFLEIAKRRSSEKQLDVIWEHRDMRDIPFKNKFDGAFCFWGSFGYFDEEGNADFIKAVSGTLKPKAKFLIDTHTTETLLPKITQKRGWKKVGDTLVLDEKEFDFSTSRTNTEWTLIHESKLFSKTTSIRLYSYRELCELLTRAGFANFESYGSLNKDPFSLDSPRLYLVASKI